MALSLSGLMSPPQEETYTWFFDPAVDREKSDFLSWSEDGRSGIVELEGQKAAVFRWMPLDPEQRDIILRLQRAGAVRAPSPVPLDQDPEARAALLRMVNVYQGLAIREAVAYGLVGVDGLDVPFLRHSTPAGPRVSDSLLRALQHPSFQVRTTFRLPVDPELPTTPEMVELDGVRYTSQTTTVRLLEDLGVRIWNASFPTEIEKKA